MFTYYYVEKVSFHEIAWRAQFDRQAGVKKKSRRGVRVKELAGRHCVRLTADCSSQTIRRLAYGRRWGIPGEFCGGTEI